MRSKVINFNDRIKEKTFVSSRTLFDQAERQGVNLNFSMESFRNFNNNLYEIYQYKHNISNYESDMDLFITNALLRKFESEEKNLIIEDILDSIWDVTVNSDEVNKNIKSKYLGKFYQIL